MGDLVHFISPETSDWETGLLIKIDPGQTKNRRITKRWLQYYVLFGKRRDFFSFEEIQWDRFDFNGNPLPVDIKVGQPIRMKHAYYVPDELTGKLGIIVEKYLENYYRALIDEEVIVLYFNEFDLI